MEERKKRIQKNDGYTLEKFVRELEELLEQGYTLEIVDPKFKKSSFL